MDQAVHVLCHCHWQRDPRSALTLVLVHGFEGSSRSHYILGTAEKAWAAGMNVVRMNIRNCGGTEHLGATFYHSGLSADVRAVLNELIERDRLPRIALAGFSLGGNQVLKLAGELGPHAPPQLCAVAAVSPGVDLTASSHALHRWQNRIYEWNFLFCLRRTLKRKQAFFPELCAPYRKHWYRSVRDFDHRVTAPHFGFASTDDYYRRASAASLLPNISVPALVVHSLDDPFIPLLPQTEARLLANPHITLLKTSAGGHCAFLARKTRSKNGRSIPAPDRRWAERMVVDFLREVVPMEQEIPMKPGRPRPDSPTA